MNNHWPERIGSCLLLLMVTAAAEGRVTIDRKPATVTHKTFDPANKPADLPELKNEEVAVCVAEFGVNAKNSYSTTVRQEKDGSYTASVLVEAVTLELGLRNVIWLPTNATEKLKAHEEGHRRIAEKVYDEVADKAARLAADKLDMKKFQATAPTQKAASDAAQAKMTAAQTEMMQYYLSETSRPGQKIQEIYDDITAHGTNLEITEADAIEQSWKKAPPPLWKSGGTTQPAATTRPTKR